MQPNTAPKAHSDLPWPIAGLAYVAAFMGPLSAGPFIGALAHDWRAAGVGLLAGICVTLLNAWLIDRFIEPVVARFQPFLQKGTPRVLANLAAFAWAVVLCALSMLAPVAIRGSDVLTGIR